jgi:hypothetical protein
MASSETSAVKTSSCGPLAGPSTVVKPSASRSCTCGVLQPQKGGAWKKTVPPSATPSGPAS